MSEILFDLQAPGAREGLLRLSGRLQVAGFTQNQIAATLNLNHPAEAPDVPVLLLRTAEPTPYHLLFRLFVLGRPVLRGALREILTEEVYDALVACCVLRESAAEVSSHVKLIPYEGLYCASDFSTRDRPGSVTAEDFVPGVSPASITLANYTVRVGGEETLDLGTGIGIHALLAARHSLHVVGSDLSARALAFARLNGLLNGFENVEWVQGSFFEPVVGRRFDLVVANPPFVISPRSKYMYRDGGLAGDGVSEHVARRVVEHLKEGGFAVMLANWFYEEGEEWDTRPRSWIEGNGCDAWVVRSADAEPLSYASNWLKQTETGDPGGYETALHQWLEYYRNEGIYRLCSGAIILRKRSNASHWVRCDTMRAIVGTRPGSDHVLRVFQAEDFLNALPSDEALLELTFRCHEDLEINQVIEPDGDGWSARSVTLGCSRGFPFGGEADTALVRFLMRLNGTAPLSQVLVALQNETGEEQEAAAYIPVVKKLIRSGMLVPV